MPLGFLGSILGAAGSVANSVGASQSAKAQQQAAADIIGDVGVFEDRSFGLIGESRGKVEGRLGDVQFIEPFDPIPFTRSTPPDDPRFIEGGTKLSRVSFDTQTGQKRENLQFTVGQSGDELRNAQLDFAQLASGDTSEFLKELGASAFGGLADSFGAPAGTFSNVSARNLFAFRTEGIRNSLALSDFFAEQGTVDPVDPLPSIFALAEFEQEEDAEKQQLDQFNRTIDFETARHNSGLSLDVANTQLGLESLLLPTGVGVLETGLDYRSNARLIGAQAAGGGAAAAGQGLSGIGSLLGGPASGFSDFGNFATRQNNSKSAYSSFLSGNSSNSLFKSLF